MFSPDGRWIAYVSNESGRDEVYVKEFGGSGAQHTISSGGGSEPVWSPAGDELFFRSDEWMLAVPIEAGEQFSAGVPTALFEGNFKREFVAGNQYYDVSADGQHFLMIEEDAALRGPDRLHLILDFARELNAEGPSGD